VRIAHAPDAAGPFVAYSALFLVPSMMFEELSVNQYFLFFMAVILASLVVRPATGETSGSSERSGLRRAAAD
jgi:hypothetical protein